MCRYYISIGCVREFTCELGDLIRATHDLDMYKEEFGVFLKVIQSSIPLCNRLRESNSMSSMQTTDFMAEIRHQPMGDSILAAILRHHEFQIQRPTNQKPCWLLLTRLTCSNPTWIPNLRNWRTSFQLAMTLTLLS